MSKNTNSERFTAYSRGTYHGGASSSSHGGGASSSRGGGASSSYGGGVSSSIEYDEYDIDMYDFESGPSEPRASTSTQPRASTSAQARLPARTHASAHAIACARARERAPAPVPVPVPEHAPTSAINRRRILKATKSSNDGKKDQKKRRAPSDSEDEEEEQEEEQEDGEEKEADEEEGEESSIPIRTRRPTIHRSAKKQKQEPNPEKKVIVPEAKITLNKANPAPIVSLWIPKGGVGKTTTTFNLSYILADIGLKVLVIDADPQQNLSKILLKKNYEATPYNGDYNKYINRPIPGSSVVPNRTLYQMLMGVRAEINPGLLDAETEVVYDETESQGGGSVHLLASHSYMGNWGEYICRSECLFDISPEARKIPGSIFAAVNMIATKIDADIVLFDLSPSSNTLERTILLSSDYYIAPTKADFFSYEGIDMMIEKSTILIPDKTGFDSPNWIEYAHSHVVTKTANSRYPFPRKNPKFLGYTVNDYPVIEQGTVIQGVVKDKCANNIEHWMGRINFLATKGARQLNKMKINGTNIPLAIPQRVYNDLNLGFNLARIRTFNQLQGLSHYFGKPVHNLTHSDLVRILGTHNITTAPMDNRGKKYNKERIETLNKVCKLFAQNILRLIAADTGVERSRFTIELVQLETEETLESTTMV
jgi:cellulose biosynthesis protein BcsQ